MPEALTLLLITQHKASSVDKMASCKDWGTS